MFDNVVCYYVIFYEVWEVFDLCGNEWIIYEWFVVFFRYCLIVGVKWCLVFINSFFLMDGIDVFGCWF